MPEIGGDAGASDGGMDFDMGPSLELGDLGDAPLSAGVDPADLDLPTPASFREPAAAPRSSARGAGLPPLADDLPVPRRSGPPAPPRSAAPPPSSGVPSLDLEDLPIPAIGDLPTPAQRDLPTPAIRDLPTPVGFDLPTPKGARGGPPPAPGSAAPGVMDLPTPMIDLPTPMIDLPTPHQPGGSSGAIDLDLPAPDLELPADLGLDDDFGAGSLPPPAGNRSNAPIVAAPGQSLADALEGGTKATGRAGVAATTGTGAERKPSKLLYIVGGVALVGLLGVLVVTQLLPGDESAGGQPVANNNPAGGTSSTGGATPVPAGEFAERAESVLAKLAEDTPASLTQAKAMVEANGDVIGQAEVALLGHLHYGPDDEQLALARGILAAHAENPAPHVRRVLALLAIIDNQLDPAIAVLSDPAFEKDAQAQTILAWAYVAKTDGMLAREAAKRAASARPNTAAAAYALATAERLIDGSTGLEAMRAGVEAYKDHLLFHEILVEALIESGRWAEASVALDAMPASNNTCAGHQAKLAVLKARLASAQGRTPTAERLYEEASKLAPSRFDIGLAHFDFLIAIEDYATARSVVDLLEQHAVANGGATPELLVAQATLAIATGRGDDALLKADAIAAANEADLRAHQIRAEVADLRQSSDDALKEADLILAAQPGSVAAASLKSRVLERKNDRAGALAALEAAVAANVGTDPKSARARSTLRRMQAQLHQRAGASKDVLASLDKAATEDPSDNAVRLERALAQLASGDRAAGQQGLVDLYERTGGMPGLTAPLGRVYLARNSLDKLEALLGTQLDDELASLETLLTGARLRVAQKRYDDAIKLTDRALVLSPGAWEAMMVKGQALLQMGELDAGLAALQESKPKEPQAELYSWIGQAYEYNGKSKEALAYYQKALEVDPNYEEAVALYGRQLAYMGAAKEAVARLEPLAKNEDAHPYVFLALGLAYKDLSKRELAISNFQKASTLDPSLFEALYWEGRLQGDAGKNAAAAAALAKAITASDSSNYYWIDAQRRLGDAYYASGRNADAKEAYQAFLKHAPANDTGRTEVARLVASL